LSWTAPVPHGGAPVVCELRPRRRSLARGLHAISPFYDTISQYTNNVAQYSGSFVFLSLLVAGFVTLAVVVSMLLTGIVRIVIYWFIGVAEQIHSPLMFLSAVLSTVSISMIPKGRSESFVIPGRALFNHVKIYDDERVISRIVDFIQTGLSDAKGQ
jgi:hypothetical protein